MKIDKADSYFSKFIRSRDNWTCQRCHTRYEPPTNALHCSHYFGRTKESVRFDEENCDALCYGCHRYWEKEAREDYRAFKVKQLGQRKFDLLTMRSEILVKRDRKLYEMYYKQQVKNL